LWRRLEECWSFLRHPDSLLLDNHLDGEQTEFRVPDHRVRDFTIRKPSSRREARRETIRRFLKERPGKGTKDLASRYRYDVESLPYGRRLYLIRPSWKKKGMDFEIWVEGYNNGGDGRPSFEELFHDLLRKRKESRPKFDTLLGYISQVYRLEEPDDILARRARPRFSTGLRVEVILKILKWFFIEQDITYWNYGGRAKLKGAIDKLSRTGRMP
jgi:hypothetical protein